MKKILLLALVVVLTAFSRDYPTKVVAVYDGDTVTTEVNLGFGLTKIEKIRLYGINAPEVRGAEKPDGLASRDALREKILYKNVALRTFKNDKRGKYGRVIGVLYLDTLNINQWMVRSGYAEQHHY